MGLKKNTQKYENIKRGILVSVISVFFFFLNRKRRKKNQKSTQIWKEKGHVGQSLDCEFMKNLGSDCSS